MESEESARGKGSASTSPPKCFRRHRCSQRVESSAKSVGKESKSLPASRPCRKSLPLGFLRSRWSRLLAQRDVLKIRRRRWLEAPKRSKAKRKSPPLPSSCSDRRCRRAKVGDRYEKCRSDRNDPNRSRRCRES